MATGTGALCPTAKRRRITTAAACASSLPALERTFVAKSSELAATAGNRAAKLGGGIELAARARSASEDTPQALNRAADKEECAQSAEFSPVASLARRTVLTAERPIQWAEPSSPMANPQPPARAVRPCRSRPYAME